MGELEKRIKRLHNIETKHGWVGRHINEEDILGIIDEMRKDFPIVIKYIGFEDNHIVEYDNSNPPKNTQKIVLVNSDKALEWFNKWLKK